MTFAQMVSEGNDRGLIIDRQDKMIGDERYRYSVWDNSTHAGADCATLAELWNTIYWWRQ